MCIHLCVCVFILMNVYIYYIIMHDLALWQLFIHENPVHRSVSETDLLTYLAK